MAVLAVIMLEIQTILLYQPDRDQIAIFDLILTLNNHNITVVDQRIEHGLTVHLKRI